MKIPRPLAFNGSALVMATLVGVAVTTYWQLNQTVSYDAAKLISAMHVFGRDLSQRGLPLPATVSLRELVEAGYIGANDVRVFEGVEVTIALTADESRSQDCLIRMKMADGSVCALLVDGSVHTLPK